MKLVSFVVEQLGGRGGGHWRRGRNEGDCFERRGREVSGEIKGCAIAREGCIVSAVPDEHSPRPHRALTTKLSLPAIATSTRGENVLGSGGDAPTGSWRCQEVYVGTTRQSSESERKSSEASERGKRRRGVLVRPPREGLCRRRKRFCATQSRRRAMKSTAGRHQALNLSFLFLLAFSPSG